MKTTVKELSETIFKYVLIVFLEVEIHHFDTFHLAWKTLYNSKIFFSLEIRFSRVQLYIQRDKR